MGWSAAVVSRSARPNASTATTRRRGRVVGTGSPSKTSDARALARVSEVLLGEPVPTTRPRRLVVAVDAFGLADRETTAALQPMVRTLSALVGEVREDLLAPPGLSAWARAQQTLQRHEAWLTFRDWIDRTNPRLQWSV